ncbi:alpha/beta fold hydrolase [Streptomyces sp. MST-110588]|uniref:lipase family alpha/beta hydrolase n=1 Tax=Streptomyces sp. MST-110588 TaxID=2833628 RepID=UPI001F5E1798|nr:alpha/beta fold hydrolase [Streptomyces sp. MST-110588]UNO40331.1 alpha/beta fold hydrolase [Streptomyces sp. MST-110588]
MKTLPFLCSLTRPSALLRATVVELAILAGHLLLYPTGIAQEQRLTDPADDPDTGTTTGTATGVTTGVITGPGAGTAGGTATAIGPTRATAIGQAPRPAPNPAIAPAIAPAIGPAAGRHGGGPTPLPTAQDSTHLPVLLLHGFIDNRSVFVLLRRSLHRHGWRHVEALNYSPLTCDIRQAAELLGRHVEEFCRRTGHHRVDVVGHSLGGLIARYYTQRLGGDHRIRTLVTLGTPHSGTRVAPLMSAHPIVRQMRPDSDVIKELAAPAPNCRTHFVCFWSDLDQVMVPARTARIDHEDLIAHNVQVSGIGHLALPVSGAVAAGIRTALGAAEAAQGTGKAISVA